VGAQQVTFKTLVREEPVLAFLTVERRSVVNHLWMDFHFVNELHVVPQLFQIPDVAVTNLADDQVALATG
jgi:hypothetical protein